MKFKLSYLIIFLLAAMTVACGKKDEPALEYEISIKESFIPAGVIFDQSDYDFLKKCRKWANETVEVNSADELPDDPLGFNSTYYKIDFAQGTLLLTYKLHIWPIDKAEYNFMRNFYTNTYDWNINITSSSTTAITPGQIYFTRLGIVVPKLPENAKLKTSVSVFDSGWEWIE